MSANQSYIRAFLSNVGLLMILNLIIKPVYIFGIERNFSNAAGDQYGIYFELLNFCIIFQVISDFGIQNFNNRFVAAQNQTFDKYFPMLLSIKVSLSAIFLLITFTVGYFTGILQKNPLMFSLIAGYIMLNTMQTYARTNLSGLGYYRLDSILSVTDKFFVVIIGLIFLFVMDLGRPLDITYLALTQFLSCAISVFIIFGFIYSKSGFIRLNFDYKYFMFFIKKMLPFTLVLALSAIFIRVDAVMLGNLLHENTEAQLSLYGNAYRQLDALNIVGFLFAGLLIPIFSNMMAKKEDINPLAKTGVGIISIVAICSAVPLCFWGDEVMRLLYTHADKEWGMVFSVLILTFIPVCLNYIFGNLIIANNRLREMNWVYFGGMILNIVLNYFAIIQYQALGAALTTLITQTLIVGALYIITLRLGLLNKDFTKYMLRLFLVLTFAVAISFVMKNWSQHFAVMLISGILIGLFALLIGIVKPKELFQILKK